MGVRARLEQLFEQWGHFVFRHPWLLLGVMLGISAFLIGQLPQLRSNTSTDDFLRADDPTRVIYDDFRHRFGRDERIMLAIEADEIFDLDFLGRLRALHEEIEDQVPFVHEIKSLINARLTRGEADELIVEDLLEVWPEGPEDLALLRQRVTSNPLYENFYISSDGRVTTIAIELDTYAPSGGEIDELAGFDGEPDGQRSGAEEEPVFLSEPESSSAVVRVREIVARHRAPGFRVQMAGGPVLTETMNRVMVRDSMRGLGLSLTVISVLLFALMRRWVSVLLPLLIVVLSMLCTLGLMALLDAPITVGTQILPAFLVAVGVCDAVHVLAVFYRRLEQGGDKEEAMAFTLGHSGLAILMTSLTTAGGLISFTAADLEPVAGLGVWAPVGVMLALVYTIVFLPALVAVVPIRMPAGQREKGHDRLGRVLVAMGDFAANRPWSVVAAATVILLVSFLGITRLHFSHNAINWFPEGDELRTGTLFMNERLGGAMVIELLVDSGGEDGLQDPALLDRLDEVRRYAEGLEVGDWSVSKTISLVDIVKESHQALNENRPDYYVIPRDRRLVAQELLLFENSGSDDLADFVDPEFRTARVTMRVPWMDSLFYPPILIELDRSLRRILGDAAELQLTGLLPLLARTFTATIDTMAKSYLIALAIITPLMILLIGHVTRGFLSMIPNLTPVIMVLGCMGWLGIPIDGSNLMVGAIVIGLAVDDTIHFMHNFRRYYDQGEDAKAAIHHTLQTTGRALLLTSLVLSAGFFVSVTAYMQNMVNFGLLAGGAILAAFLANVLLASALMVIATRRDEARRREGRGAPVDRPARAA